MRVDWGALRAVVLESDDWGLCAWVPDEAAWRALSESPAFQSPAGQIYGRSTLETEADVSRLAAVLGEFQGADGFPPTWQANTILAAPDFDLLASPEFRGDAIPLMDAKEMPSRWRRPFLEREVDRAIEAGVWWPELHGLHHLPDLAWREALRGGDADARTALAQQCVVCAAVEAGGEYDPAEPPELRRRNLEEALHRFGARFGRSPTSMCPPDYRWDEALEADAEGMGLTLFQGKFEQKTRFGRLRRWLLEPEFPNVAGARFYMPPRIAFEPRGDGRVGAPLGAAATRRRVREAWKRGEPAVVSTHRVNYAHLDPAWSAAGRTALRDLLGRLMTDGATFLTDAEVRSLAERGWSLRPIAATRAVLRRYGGGGDPVRFPAPAASGLRASQGRAAGVSVAIEGGEAVVSIGHGECLLDWGGA